MTLRVLWSRLRKRNKKDYRQFQLCIVFAMMLVSSYLMMLYSPLVKSAMPEGGDTGKMAYLNLGIAVIGCTMFVWYATRRFLRYKSREIGIFMALGAEKGMLSGALFAEMSSMIGIYALEGILCGGVVAVVVGKVMEFVTREVNEVPFGFSVMSIVGALIYGVLLLILAIRGSVDGIRNLSWLFSQNYCGRNDGENSRRMDKSVLSSDSDRCLSASGLLHFLPPERA